MDRSRDQWPGPWGFVIRGDVTFGVFGKKHVLVDKPVAGVQCAFRHRPKHRIEPAASARMGKSRFFPTKKDNLMKGVRFIQMICR